MCGDSAGGRSVGEQPEGIGLLVEVDDEVLDLIFGDRVESHHLVGDASGKQDAHDSGVGGTPLGVAAFGAGEPIAAFRLRGVEFQYEVVGRQLDIPALMWF